jgi:hypothetical protein
MPTTWSEEEEEQVNKYQLNQTAARLVTSFLAPKMFCETQGPWLLVAVCTGRAALALIAQIMFSTGPGSVQMTAIKHYIEHFGLSRAILLSQRKSYS